MTIEIEELLENEYEEIKTNYWKFLDNTYKSNIEKQYHRSKIGNFINIQNIKKELYELLGAIPIFVFLTEICSKIKMPSPVYNVEKGILILKLLVDGCSINDMKIYDENDSFYRIYKSVFIDNIDFLENWVNNTMFYCFSNSITRLLYSKLYNPKNFEHCTLLLDGRHNRIVIEDIDLNKKDLYSYKLKKNALNTQFIIDSAGYIIYVSESLPCKFNNDDNMFINNINLMKFFKLTDCLCYDGLYENVLDEILKKYNNVGLHITENNFCFPIKKEKNIDLDVDELNFNKQLGSYRSTIETFFAKFSNIFKRFSYKANARITKEKTYNIQIKLALVLFNIKNFVENNNIEEKSYYKLWMEKDFDFFDTIKDFNIETKSIKAVYKKENIMNMKSLQDDLLNKLLSDNNFKISLTKNKMQIDNDDNNTSTDKNVYEIQYIIQHRKINNEYEYEVKWRNYKKQVNSWIKESDFQTKDILKNYWDSINV